MCEALDDHQGGASIGVNDSVVNEEKERTGVLVARLDTNHYKVRNGEWSRPDESDDKQHKWLPKRDQDKRLEARSSGELQGPCSKHL